VTILVDTSALFALLDADDLNHTVAADVFGRFDRRDRLVTHNYMVAEACALAQRRLGATSAVVLLERTIPLIEITWVTLDLHEAAVAAFVAAASRSISFVDRVSFELMRREGISAAFTFDADFSRAGFRVLP
jgi:uncharacterized protein